MTMFITTIRIVYYYLVGISPKANLKFSVISAIDQ